MPVAREQYDAAKQRQRDNEIAFRAQNPTAEVLADVAAIIEWETAEHRRQFPDPPDPCAGMIPRPE